MEEIEMPAVSNLESSADAMSADLTFDPSARYFKGHFPGFPVLAGVVQLCVARRFAEKAFGCNAALKCVKKLKFSRVVQPGEKVHFSLSRKSDAEVVFAYEKGGVPCATGVMCF